MSSASDRKLEAGLANIAKKKDFGTEGSADPVEAGRRGGMMRAAQRRIAHMDFKTLNEMSEEALLERLRGSRGTFTMSDYLAIKRAIRAQKDGAEYEALINNVEGKLVDRKVTTQAKSLAELLSGIEEECDDASGT
jgi:hypothetical protein